MSINYKSTKGIFLQIAENICQQILAGKLNAGDRIPSVRDLSGEYEVNRNTLLRTYSLLEESGVFTNKRGIGFFVSENAVEIILEKEKKEFFQTEMPELIQKVKLLKLTENDMSELIEALKRNNKVS